MEKMTITFSTQWPDNLNTTRLGVLTANVKCRTTSVELLQKINETVISVEEAYILEKVNKITAIREARQAYKIIGNDPNRYRPSADSLIRRIVKGKGIYQINNVVDILNMISIASGFSIGGYDSAKINGVISMGIGSKEEEYVGIGRGSLNINKLPVLRDELGPFGCPTSDSERTMINSGTEDIIFIFFDFGNNKNLVVYLEECVTLLEEYAFGKECTLEIIETEI